MCIPITALKLVKRSSTQVVGKKVHGNNVHGKKVHPKMKKAEKNVHIRAEKSSTY